LGIGGCSTDGCCGITIGIGCQANDWSKSAGTPPGAAPAGNPAGSRPGPKTDLGPGVNFDAGSVDTIELERWNGSAAKQPTTMMTEAR
jgi:hypothetical protein